MKSLDSNDEEFVEFEPVTEAELLMGIVVSWEVEFEDP
jgi:hypothetical protein